MNLTKEFIDALALASMEWQLQQANALLNGDAECTKYLQIKRNSMPARIAQLSVEDGTDADQTVHNLIRGVHQRHLDGKAIF